MLCVFHTTPAPNGPVCLYFVRPGYRDGYSCILTWPQEYSDALYRIGSRSKALELFYY